MSLRDPMQIGSFVTQPRPNDFPKIIDMTTDQETGDVYVKAFLIDDTTNGNFWKIPNEYMKKYSNAFIGRPLIRHPSGGHPDYVKEAAISDGNDDDNSIRDILRYQDHFKIGEIIDVNYETRKDDPKKKAWFATIRMTNDYATSNLKSGAFSNFVSPQIYDIEGSNSNEPTKDFIPLHLAIVDEPAFGDRAKIRGICTGSGIKCMNALRSAAKKVMDDYHSSSFFKKSASDNHTLTNPNLYDPNNPQNHNDSRYWDPNTQTYYYSNQQGTGGQSSPQQVLSQKQQTQAVDAEGNLITNTTDKKPTRGSRANQNNNQNQNFTQPQTAQATQVDPTSQQEYSSTPQSNPQSQDQPVPQTGQLANPRPISQNSQTPLSGTATGGIGTSQINATDPQMPSALLDALKEIEMLKQENSEFRQFKQTLQDKQIKEASEQQRQLIESFLTPDLVPDEAARTEMIDYFVGLNIQDDDIKKILELVVNGKFTASQQGAAGKKPPAPKPDNVNSASLNKKVKGASLILNHANRSSNTYRDPTRPQHRSSSTAFSNGLMSGVNVDNLNF